MTTYTSPRGQRNLARFVAGLKVKPRTAAQLASDLYIGKPTVIAYLNHLRQTGQAYIHDWLDGDDGQVGNLAPLYAYGNAEDKKRPPKKSAKKKRMDYLRRVEADPERKMALQARKRLAKRKAKPDPAYLWLAAATCPTCGKTKARAQFYGRRKECRACLHWTNKQMDMREAA